MAGKKVMLLGEIGVGKTSLAQRLLFDRFDADYKSTIGVDLYKYDIDIPGEAAPVALVLWDTDGNWGESLFRHVYVKGATAAVIVGDVSRRSTLETMLQLADGFEAVNVASRRAREAEHLLTLNDEALARKGLTRDQIAKQIFATRTNS